MDWNSFLNHKLVRGLFCVVLIGALVLGLVYPSENMKKAQPENPFQEEHIQDIHVLQVGEKASKQLKIAAPGSIAGSGQTKDSEDAEEADGQEPDKNNQEANDSKTKNQETNEQDVQLLMNWWEKGLFKKNLTCDSSEIAEEKISSNQLGGGSSLPYEFQLIGDDAKDGRILHIKYTSDAGDGGSLESKGSLLMSMPEHETSNTYRIEVEALVNGETLTFEILLYYSNDVTLRMQYSVREDGVDTEKIITCENKKTRTAETVYDNQLTQGRLSYAMDIVGADGERIKISSVSCYQSGSGRTVSLDREDAILLLLNQGKTGENTFTVKAKDTKGNNYQFVINIPYKHKGEKIVKISTNLTDGQKIINEMKTNLTVKAWSEKSDGSVLSYIPANGTDTKLIVRLDGKEIIYTSSSGKASEYDLYPENPKKGDSNSHRLSVYAEDAYGNYGELTLNLKGKRKEAGQKVGTASIYIDMTALGIGVLGPVKYTVLADEPVSYTIAKAVMGKDTGAPFGSVDDTFGFSGRYAGTLDDGFYLQSLNVGYKANAMNQSKWPGTSEKEVLAAIDDQFGKGTGLATLWRCLYRNGLNKSSGSGKSYGEFDYTSGSGWMYSIGGTLYYPGQSMSSVYLKDGDTLTLRYTLAYGWDVGGGTAGYGSTVGYCVSAVGGDFRINHRMEAVTGKDGTTKYVCHCCGLQEECLHKNVQWKDLKDGTHAQVCKECGEMIGDPKDHEWESSGGESSQHKCTKCGATQDHKWKEIKGSNTATCTEAGIRKLECTVCHAVREEKTSAKGHTYNHRWYCTKEGHYQKCSTCGETTALEKHQYVYDEEWDEYICKICDAVREEDMNSEDKEE